MRELFPPLVGVCRDMGKQVQDASEDIQRLQAQLDVHVKEKAQMQSQLDLLLEAVGISPSAAARDGQA